MNEPTIVSGNQLHPDQYGIIVSGRQLRPDQYGIVVSRTSSLAPPVGTIFPAGQRIWRNKVRVLPLELNPTDLVRSHDALPGKYRVVGPASEDAAGIYHRYYGARVTKTEGKMLRLDDSGDYLSFDYWLEPVGTPCDRGPNSWPSYYEKSFDGLKNGYRPGTVGPIAGRPTITITRLGPADDVKPSPGVGLKFGSPLVANETWWTPYALRQVAEVFKELADQVEGADSSGSP